MANSADISEGSASTAALLLPHADPEAIMSQKETPISFNATSLPPGISFPESRAENTEHFNIPDSLISFLRLQRPARLSAEMTTAFPLWQSPTQLD